MVRSSEQLLQRNVALYPWYAGVFNALFWMPVFVLYFLEHMPLSQVLLLEAVYYAGIVALEVPSGYFSDRLGRKPTLIIANVCLILAYGLFILGGSDGGGFAVFAVAQVLLAGGLAFNSGTDTSMHFDSLAALGEQGAFDDREARVARNGLLGSGLAGLIGGAVGLIDLRWAYGLSAVAAAGALALACLMTEPTSHERKLQPVGPWVQLKVCAGLLRDRTLAWVFASFVLLTVLNHVPYEFYQPYLKLTLSDMPAMQGSTPLAAGVHVGLVMLVAAGFAGRSIALRDRLGLPTVLLGAAGVQVVLALAMALVVHPVVVALLLLRSVPRALMAAPINTIVAPRVETAQRATYLSMQSLAGRLAFSAFLVLLSQLPALGGGEEEGNVLTVRLLVAAGVGGVGILLLAALWPMVRGTQSIKGTD